MSWSFIEHITKALERPRLGDSKEPTLWPSEATGLQLISNKQKIVGKCRRERYFRYLLAWDEYDNSRLSVGQKMLAETLRKNQTPIDKYLRWIWIWGDQAEDITIAFSKSTGVYTHDQVPIYLKEYNLSGKMDILCWNPVTKKRTIVEVKSVYGHNADYTLGSHFDRKDGKLGTPKDSNLLQIAIYHWWWASKNPEYEESRLVYLARDTGRFAEYLIKTEEDPQGNIWIFYKYNAPVTGNWINSGITINSVLEGFKQTEDSLNTEIIPNRDYDLLYSVEKLNELYNEKELNKTDTEKHKKWLLREKYNSYIGSLKNLTDEEILTTYSEFSEELAASILAEEDPVKLVKKLRKATPKQTLKPVEKGDWQCRLCSHKQTCYNSDATPKEILVE